MLRINLGAGASCWPDFENSDIAPYAGSGGIVYVDMTKPLPYRDCSVSVAMMSHSYILWGQGSGLLEELHRVLIPGGWLRIDDHKQRAYRTEEERDWSFPRSFPRQQLITSLSRAGFDPVLEIDPDTTLIPETPAIRAQILANKRWHQGFTIEAQKPDDHR